MIALYWAAVVMTRAVAWVWPAGDRGRWRPWPDPGRKRAKLYDSKKGGEFAGTRGPYVRDDR